MIFSAQMQEQDQLCLNRTEQLQYLIKQFMRISIIILFIFSASLQLLSATTAKGQDMSVEKVTVALRDESVFSAIKQIEKQTSLRFFYQRSALKQLDRLTMPSGSRTVEQTLYALLQNTNLSFIQIDQSIIIKPNAQAPQPKRKISGTVFTSDTKEPIKFASVLLIRKSDLQTVGQSATDANGSFELSTTDSAAHLLRVSLLGYRIYSQAIKDEQDVALPPIYLIADPTELKEVVVSARSPLVKQEVDRLSYNVQADPESKTSTVLDMLRKVPLVTVDADENIKLKGSSSFKVLIDGHTSSLVVSNPRDIFRSMAASSVLRIEVITIPPAKYDSEGLAGIINVITVKNRIDGYNANMGTSYKFPNGLRANGGLNFKRDRVALSTIVAWNQYNTPLRPFTNYRKSLSSAAYTNQEGTAETTSDQGLLTNQLSFEADSLNLFTLTASYGGSKNHRLGDVLTTQQDNGFQQYRIANDGRNRQESYGAGLDYQKGFRGNKNQLLSFSYQFSSRTNNQFNSLKASEQVNTVFGDYDQTNNARLNEHTAQVDYAQPFKQLTVELGAKAILRNTKSEFGISGINPVDGLPLAATANDNDFNYDQNIFSAYNSYQLSLKKWTLKAGLRLESTNINADFSNIGHVNIPDYTNVLPSVAIQRKLSPSANLNFGYTERIQRPGILQLNPYVDRQNPYFITYGNPELKPELNHSFSLAFSSYKTLGITAGVGYTFSNNTIQYVSLLGQDGITRNTYQNLGSNNSLDLNLNLNYPLTKRLGMSLNAQTSFVRLKGIIDGLNYSRNGVTASGSLFLNYNFGNEWRGVGSLQYFSPGITLQSTSINFYYLQFGLTKAVLNKKLYISGSFSNPYQRYLDFKNTVKDPRFTQVTHESIVYRRFNLGVSYQFGKLRDGSIKKNKKTVQNDDIKVIRSIIPIN